MKYAFREIGLNPIEPLLVIEIFKTINIIIMINKDFKTKIAIYKKLGYKFFDKRAFGILSGLSPDNCIYSDIRKIDLIPGVKSYISESAKKIYIYANKIYIYKIIGKEFFNKKK